MPSRSASTVPSSSRVEPPREADQVTVRPLETHADYQACVALQRTTWGERFSECVPASILKVNQRIGGVSAGAFAPNGRLLGFVFGMTGVEPGGRLVHWSDMLAVRAEARNLGIGQRLKEFQRAAVERLGVEVIYWTFDPLVARNAHLNLNKLGAEVAEYVPDMYGETDSDLHRGLGTDRFVVAWRIGAPAAGRDASGTGPILTDAGGADALHGGAAPPPSVRIEVPPDIAAVQAASLDQAAAWRTRTREAFLVALSRGYVVARLEREAETGRCFYLLTHPTSTATD